MANGLGVRLDVEHRRRQELAWDKGEAISDVVAA